MLLWRDDTLVFGGAYIVTVTVRDNGRRMNITMPTNSQLSHELNESVNNLIGKNAKLLHKALIRVETRGDKTDNRVLVLSTFRVFIVTAKIPSRVDFHFHYLEIESLESKKPNHLCFTLVTDHKPISILIGDDNSGAELVTLLLTALIDAIGSIFPDVAFSDIIPCVSVPINHKPEHKNKLPCGGFSVQYAAMCDLYQTPFREEVAWDVDTIYLAHDIRMLNLKDFEHLDHKDLVPLICVLQHNVWFNGVDAGSYGMERGSSGGMRASDAWDAVARAVRRGVPGPAALRARDAGLRSDHAAKLGHALRRTRRTPRLHTVDFSGNNIEDKGATALLGGLLLNSLGLRHISFAQCGITGKTVSQLSTILTENTNNLDTLVHLDLSNNNLKDDVHNLYNFLAQPNILRYLNLSNTETTLENLWGALLRGCAGCLSELIIARNPWSSNRRSKEPPPSFRQFFTSCLSLTHLDMSHCRLPQDALKSLLLGLACNESASGLKLKLTGAAGGGALSGAGGSAAAAAHVLESCIHGVRCLTSLDLSETSMDIDLAGVITAIGRNHSITHLSLSRLTGKKSHAAPIIQALVQVLQEPDTALESLDLSDCKLKSDLYALLNALGGARTLKYLDISGNLAGDAGARLLAKALQANSTLEILYMDRNAISLQGLCEVGRALKSAVRLRVAGFPGADAAAAGRVATDRLLAIWRELDEKRIHHSYDHHTQNTLTAQALQRAWAGRTSSAGTIAQAAGKLPPSMLPTALSHAAMLLHQNLHQYLQNCADVFASCGGDPAISGAIPESSLPFQLVQETLAPCAPVLQAAIDDAVSNLTMVACDGIIRNGTDVTTPHISDPSTLLAPVSHSMATPVGGRRRSGAGIGTSRRVRPKSVAEQQDDNCSSELHSLPPLPLTDLTPPTLHHIVKGRPRRAKTRAPSRPITDQAQDIGDGLDIFWRACGTPPGSEDTSFSQHLSQRSYSLHSRSLRSLHSRSSVESRSHSPTLQQDDTMYSLTSGESTPVLLDGDNGRSRSTDSLHPTAIPVIRSSILHSATVGGGGTVMGGLSSLSPRPLRSAPVPSMHSPLQPTAPPACALPSAPPAEHEASRSTDNVNKLGNGCARNPGKVRPWSVAGGNANDTASCTTEGVEACVGGSIVGITPGAALTSSMLRDRPLTPEEEVG